MKAFGEETKGAGTDRETYGVNGERGEGKGRMSEGERGHGSF